MKEREQEYFRIFIAESLEEYDEISRIIVSLEEDPGNSEHLNEIFRLLHNLKANANAMGFPVVAELAHKLENVFTSLRNKSLTFENQVVEVVLSGIDLLGARLKSLDRTLEKSDIEEGEKVNQALADLIGGKEVGLPVQAKKYFTAQQITLSDLVSIEVKKLDDLLNLVGELMIDRDRIYSLSKKAGMEELQATSTHLYRITNQIQERVMDARLVSLGTLLNKFPRIVRDISVTEGKKIHLELSGQDIRIDRNILQFITDSMLHLVRNCITHGIESREDRLKAGKPATGTITITAESDKDIVVIKVSDDGKGVDIDRVKTKVVELELATADKIKNAREAEVLSYLFEPGFSMARQVTEFSGRGIGLDVVKGAIDSMGGNLKVSTRPGRGTTFRLALPTSIAVKSALLFEVNRNVYGIPLIHIDHVAEVSADSIHQVGEMLMADIHGENIPVIYLSDFFSDNNAPIRKENLARAVNNLIIVSHNNRKTGLISDTLLRQQEIVVKPMQHMLAKNDLFSGVTLLGSGDVCLVLDVPAVSRIIHKRKPAMV